VEQLTHKYVQSQSTIADLTGTCKNLETLVGKKDALLVALTVDVTTLTSDVTASKEQAEASQATLTTTQHTLSRTQASLARVKTEYEAFEGVCEGKLEDAKSALCNLEKDHSLQVGVVCVCEWVCVYAYTLSHLHIYTLPILHYTLHTTLHTLPIPTTHTTQLHYTNTLHFIRTTPDPNHRRPAQRRAGTRDTRGPAHW
jgi:hypothetical protein